MKYLYPEDYKTLMKNIKEDTNKWKASVPGLEELILLKCQYYEEQSTDSLQSLARFQRHFFFFLQKQKKILLKFIQNRPQIAKETEKEEQSRSA